jgi:hypothetical protein
MRTFSLALSCVILFLMGAYDCQAGEEYYLLMFGSQQIPNRPSHSHSFATFVKVVSQDDVKPGEIAPVVIESRTVSWLPETMEVHALALIREPGQNFELHTTIRHVLDDGQRVSMWGPYRIQPELYCLATEQASVLDSGVVKYKAIDTGHRADHVTNCIHAVGSVSHGWRRASITPTWGESASFDLLRSFRKWICDRDKVEPWVATVLCLEQYPIIWREWGNPHSNSIFGPAYRALGGEAQLQSSYGPPARPIERIPPPRSPELIPAPR